MNERIDVAAIVGSGLVLSIFVSLAMIAVGGWDWFAAFLAGPAANWFQAIGSLLALLLAWHLARVGRFDQKIAARQAAIAYTVKVNAACKHLAQACVLSNFGEIKVQHRALIDALPLGQAVPVTQLSVDSLTPYLTVLHYAAEASVIAEEVLGGRRSLIDAARRLEELEEWSKHHGKELGRT